MPRDPFLHCHFLYMGWVGFCFQFGWRVHIYNKSDLFNNAIESDNLKQGLLHFDENDIHVINNGWKKISGLLKISVFFYNFTFINK